MSPPGEPLASGAVGGRGGMSDGAGLDPTGQSDRDPMRSCHARMIDFIRVANRSVACGAV